MSEFIAACVLALVGGIVLAMLGAPPWIGFLFGAACPFLLDRTNR